MDVPQAGRLARPAWLNGRTVLGLVIFALAFLGAQRTIESRQTGTSVWVAGRDLSVGQTLSPSDLTLAEVSLPSDMKERYALAATDLSGTVVVQPISEGQLIPLGAVGEGEIAGPGRTMSVPVEIEHAVGGRLGPGDVVDVYATFDSAGGRARTVLLIEKVNVVDRVASGDLIAQDATVGLTLAVSPDDAARLAFAVRTGSIDVVRVDDPSRGSTASRIESGDF